MESKQTHVGRDKAPASPSTPTDPSLPSLMATLLISKPVGTPPTPPELSITASAAATVCEDEEEELPSSVLAQPLDLGRAARRRAKNEVKRAKLEKDQTLSRDEMCDLYKRAAEMICLGLVRKKCDELMIEPLSRCLLCLKKKPGVKTDHLMPNFVYRCIAAKLGGSVKFISSAQASPSDRNDMGYAFFCSECEGRFSGLEQVATFFVRVCNASTKDELGVLLNWELPLSLGFDKFALSVLWRDAMLARGDVDEIRRIAELLLRQDDFNGNSLVQVEITCEDYFDKSKRNEYYWCPWSSSSAAEEGEPMDYVSLVGPFTFSLLRVAQKPKTRVPWACDLHKSFREHLSKPDRDWLQFLSDHCAYSVENQGFLLEGFTEIKICERLTSDPDVVLYCGKSKEGTDTFFAYIPKSYFGYHCAFEFISIDVEDSVEIALYQFERTGMIGHNWDLRVSWEDVLLAMAYRLFIASREGEWVPVN